MAVNDTRDPAEIERDIRATQRDMSRTVDEIGAQLTPRNLMNMVFDKADSNGIDARFLLDQAKRNPLALAMIAIGGIWLVSDSDARPSALKPEHKGSSQPNFGSWDAHYRGYVEHMARCEPRPDEDELAYRRRRDQARATYLMVEQRHGEEESSFRKRLDEATEKMREQRDRITEKTHETSRAMSERSGQMGRQMSAQGGRVAHKVESAFTQNPLIGGLVAAAVGAIAGSAIPVSRTEEEKLGRMGSDALDTAREKAHQAGEQLHQKKDEMVEKADEKVRKAGKESGTEPTSTTRVEEVRIV